MAKQQATNPDQLELFSSIIMERLPVPEPVFQEPLSKEELEAVSLLEQRRINAIRWHEGCLIYYTRMMNRLMDSATRCPGPYLLRHEMYRAVIADLAQRRQRSLDKLTELQADKG